MKHKQTVETIQELLREAYDAAQCVRSCLHRDLDLLDLDGLDKKISQAEDLLSGARDRLADLAERRNREKRELEAQKHAQKSPLAAQKDPKNDT